MDDRRIRPLFLPPHPRRNPYIPIWKYYRLSGHMPPIAAAYAFSRLNNK